MLPVTPDDFHSIYVRQLPIDYCNIEIKALEHMQAIFAKIGYIDNVTLHLEPVFQSTGCNLVIFNQKNF